jgi:hypothetical protein
MLFFLQCVALAGASAPLSGASARFCDRQVFVHSVSGDRLPSFDPIGGRKVSPMSAFFHTHWFCDLQPVAWKEWGLGDETLESAMPSDYYELASARAAASGLLPFERTVLGDLDAFSRWFLTKDARIEDSTPCFDDFGSGFIKALIKAWDPPPLGWPRVSQGWVGLWWDQAWDFNKYFKPRPICAKSVMHVTTTVVTILASLAVMITSMFTTFGAAAYLLSPGMSLFASMVFYMAIISRVTSRSGAGMGGLFRISSRFLLLVLFLSRIAPGAAVTCHTCWDQCAGCTGGGACPFIATTQANNTALAAAGTGVAVLTLTHLLPIKFLRVLTQTVMACLSTVARRPAAGTPIDLSTKTSEELGRISRCWQSCCS